MSKFDEIMKSTVPPDYAVIERAIAEKYGISADAILPVFSKPRKLTEAEIEYIAVAESRRDALFAKLESGYNAIEALAADPEHDPDQLRQYEEYWKVLKADYDTVCDELARELAR